MKKNSIFYLALIFVIFALLFKVLAIIFYPGDYDLIFDTISQTGVFFVSGNFNFPGIIFFALFCVLVSLLNLLLLFSSKLDPKLRNNFILTILISILSISIFLLSVLPSDLVYGIHLVFAGLVFTISMAIVLIFVYYIRKRIVILFSIFLLISFILMGIFGIISQFFNPNVPVGIFEKIFIYGNMFFALFLIRHFSRIEPKKQNLKSKRKR